MLESTKQWLKLKPYQQRGFSKNLLYGLIRLAEQRELPEQLYYWRHVRFRRPIRSLGLLAKVFRGRISTQSMMLHLYGEDMLRDALACCQNLRLRPFLAFGTLLGYYRDGGFIEHDQDVDLGLMEEDYARRPQLIDLMKARGYLVRLNTDDEVSFYKEGLWISRVTGCFVDFWRFARQGEKVVRGIYDESKGEQHAYVFSADIFDDFTKVRFMGRQDVLVPSKTEKFLQESYGNWRIPKTDFDIFRDHPNMQA
jgi:hypothetical protein